GKGHDDTLLMRDLHQLLERHGMRIATERVKTLRQHVERLFYDWPRPGDRLVQTRQVEIRAIIQDRRQSRKTYGTTKVAHQVEQARSILHPLRRQSAKRDVVDRND